MSCMTEKCSGISVMSLSINLPSFTVALLPARIKQLTLLRLKFCNSLVRIRAFLNIVPRETFQMCFRETNLIIFNADLHFLGVPHSDLGQQIACNSWHSWWCLSAPQNKYTDAFSYITSNSVQIPSNSLSNNMHSELLTAYLNCWCLT
jgi:hypothetical protein